MGCVGDGIRRCRPDAQAPCESSHRTNEPRRQRWTGEHRAGEGGGLRVIDPSVGRHVEGPVEARRDGEDRRRRDVVDVDELHGPRVVDGAHATSAAEGADEHRLILRRNDERRTQQRAAPRRGPTFPVGVRRDGGRLGPLDDEPFSFCQLHGQGEAKVRSEWGVLRQRDRIVRGRAVDERARKVNDPIDARFVGSFEETSEQRKAGLACAGSEALADRRRSGATSQMHDDVDTHEVPCGHAASGCDPDDLDPSRRGGRCQLRDEFSVGAANEDEALQPAGVVVEQETYDATTEQTGCAGERDALGGGDGGFDCHAAYHARVSGEGPFGGDPNDPLGGFPLDPAALARMFSASGPVNWELARLAVAQSTEDSGNVDPLRRIRLEELLRVAELHIAQATGLATTMTGAPLVARAMTAGQWATRTLDDFREMFERLGVAMTPEAAPPDPDAATDPFSRMFADVPKMLAPLLLGSYAGMMVGQLAGRAFGQYDPPLPRPASDELAFVPAHIDAFADDWSLDVDDVSLWVCLSEVAHHSVLGRPHVAHRLRALILEHAGSFRPDPVGMQERLNGLDPNDPAAFQSLASDPDALFGAMRTDAQRALLPRLEALVVALEGYVDHILDVTGHNLLGSYGSLTEALRRRRLDERSSDRLVAHIAGLELGEAQYARGTAFVRGILERAGEDGLARLWESERTLPTPAEIDAPGLWLARIDLD